MNLEPVARFGFTRNPFAQDLPWFIPYETESLREALRELFFFLGLREGLALLIGEDGSGKTTVLKTFMNRLKEDYLPVLVQGKYEREDEVLKAVFQQIGLEKTSFAREDLKKTLQEIVTRLFTEKKELVLMIDNAQQLGLRALFFLTYLSEIEFPLFKPFHIILAANRVFFHALMEKNMRDVVKKVSVVHVLRPLSWNEVIYYVNHRLNFASSLYIHITLKALETVLLYSRGNPLWLNTLLEKALTEAAKRGTTIIDRKIVQKAITDSNLLPVKQRGSSLRVFLLFLLSLILSCLAIFRPRYVWDYWLAKIMNFIGGAIP